MIYSFNSTAHYIYCNVFLQLPRLPRWPRAALGEVKALAVWSCLQLYKSFRFRHKACPCWPSKYLLSARCLEPGSACLWNNTVSVTKRVSSLLSLAHMSYCELKARTHCVFNLAIRRQARRGAKQHLIVEQYIDCPATFTCHSDQGIRPKRTVIYSF